MNRPGNTLARRKVLSRVLAERGDTLVVAGLGTTNYDLFAVSDVPENVYLWGAMGITVPIGLGLALAQPGRRVLVVTGDGDMMMGIGSLAVIAAQAPDNLGILVMDNECFEETGGQTGLTASGVDIAGIARAAGFAEAVVITDEAAVDALPELLLKRPGPVIAVAKVGLAEDEPVYPSMDGPSLARTFREAVVGR